MQLIKQKAPSKTWRLIRNKDTGDIYTGYYGGYSRSPTQLAKDIAEADAAIAAGQTVADMNANYWRGRFNPAGIEQLDHIPYYRIKLRFSEFHHGNSTIQVVFKSQAGGEYWLEGVWAKSFFLRVGEGTIKMDSAGFYEFNISFVKKSEKVFMTLEPDEMHV